MKPVFVLSLPRSRTAWLTVYLNGCDGIKAIHDGWKYAKNAKQLKSLMERYPGIVVNADSTNILFLDEIRAEFPEAKFVKIIRPIQDVEQSMKASYGEHNYSNILALSEILEKADAGVTVEFDNWTILDTTRIYKYITDGGDVDPLWHLMAHDFKVAVTDHRIENDLLFGQHGQLEHIVNKLRG